MADFFEPLLGKYSVLETRFLCRGMIPLSIHAKKWKSIIITLGDYFGSYQIEAQRNMVGFVVDGHIWGSHWHSGQKLMWTLSTLSVNVQLIRRIPATQSQPHFMGTTKAAVDENPCGFRWSFQRIYVVHCCGCSHKMARTTTANNTITVLRSLFARYGIPNQIVSDNGP